jgi:hypothetical protein
MTNLTPPPQRTITTTDELQALVAHALVSGTLDISDYIIDVEFNLPDLLKHCGQPEIEVEIENKEDGRIKIRTIECPFGLNASHTKFNKKVNCKNATFLQKVNFASTTFIDGAIFSSINFKDEACFHSAEFLAVSFESSIFNKDAQFSGAKFKGRTMFSSARFDRLGLFSNTLFKGEAAFASVKFNKLATFNHSTFDRRAVFYNSEFNEYTNFDSAVFNGEADFATVFNGITSFNLVTFNQEACFVSAVFKQKVTFEKLIKTNDGILTLDISRCQITDNGCLVIDYKEPNSNPPMLLKLEGIECDGDAVRVKIRDLSPESNAKIEFKKCYFYGKNVAFTNVAMKNVTVTRGNTVKGMLFDHCHFEEQELPKQFPDNLLGDLKFKALVSSEMDSIKDLALLYASLKTTATNGGETQLANDFHFWQQYYQGKLKFSLWNTLYKYTSAYGQDVKLPLIWFVALLITFACFYTLFLKPTLLPIEALLIFSFIGTYSLLPAIVEYTILKKLNIFSFVYYGIIAIFSIVLLFCVLELNETLVKGLPISISGSLPFMFSDNETIKALLPTLPKSISYDWDFWRVVGFYFGYILQHLTQGFVLFQIGAAIRNKVKR